MLSLDDFLAQTQKLLMLTSSQDVHQRRSILERICGLFDEWIPDDLKDKDLALNNIREYLQVQSEYTPFLQLSIEKFTKLRSKSPYLWVFDSFEFLIADHEDLKRLQASENLLKARRLLFRGDAELRLSYDSLNDIGLGIILISPFLGELTHFCVYDGSFSNEGLQNLANTEALPNLKVLYLENIYLGDKSGQILSNGKLFQTLYEIHLPRCHLSGSEIYWILSSSGLKNLRLLNLDGICGYFSNQWNGDLAHIIASSFALSELETLYLGENRMDSYAIELLSNTYSLQTLKILHLNRNTIGNEGAIALSHSFAFSNLCELRLDGGCFVSVIERKKYEEDRGCTFGAVGAKAILGSMHLKESAKRTVLHGIRQKLLSRLADSITQIARQSWGKRDFQRFKRSLPVEWKPYAKMERDEVIDIILSFVDHLDPVLLFKERPYDFTPPLDFVEDALAFWTRHPPQVSAETDVADGIWSLLESRFPAILKKLSKEEKMVFWRLLQEEMVPK